MRLSKKTTSLDLSKLNLVGIGSGLSKRNGKDSSSLLYGNSIRSMTKRYSSHRNEISLEQLDSSRELINQ